MIQQVKGHGIVQISSSLYPELDSPSTPEEWHKKLLLPDTFTVESIAKNDRLGVYELTVSSEFLPDVEGIHITPVYLKDFREVEDEMVSQVTLTKIELTWNNLGTVEVIS